MEEFESPNNLIFLIKKICEKYELKPSVEQNIINVKAFLNKLNGNSIFKRYKNLEDSNNFIINCYGDYIKNNRFSIPDELDKIHENLIKIINIPGDDAINLSKVYKNTFKNKEKLSNKEFGNLSILDLDMPERIETIKYLNYDSLMRKEYMIIDSRYQNIVNTDLSKIEFNLITNSRIRSDNGGVIVGNSIKDIIKVKISAFTIPYKPIFVNFYNKITLTINEWVANSYEAYEGGQFHFIFDIDKVNNNLIYLIPTTDEYEFSTPVNYIDNFTLSFGAMLPKITFDQDRMYVKTFEYITEYGIITFENEHNLVTGDLVYLSGFTTLELAKDVNIINEVNRDSGHIIVKKDNFSVLLNINLSLVRHEVPVGSGIYPMDSYQQNVLVYFASKRIKIPITLTYLTNYSNNQT